ncbi:MAG: DUF92 domain-containing protein [Clostridiales bacterium]|nr:DUF92 domain-containing protein [Clostridiales bacterium]
MIENTVLGVALTAVVPFGVLGLASVARKLGAGAEGSRKLVHILLSNWILLALAVYNSAWAACILPACFIPLNYLSCRKGLFSAMERDEDNTFGTVWYAVSLFLLCFAGYSLDMPWIAACGMLAMGYGDGFGALVGKRWGKLYFPGKHSLKSLEGMLVVMLLSGIAAGIVCAVYAHDPYPGFALRAALACAVPAGAIELFTPRGIDNLTLPLGVGFIVFLLAKFPPLWPVFACLNIALLILIAAYYLRSITFWALQAAALLGVSLFIFGGWLSFTALVLFFIFGSAVSRIGKNKKAASLALHERRGARSVAQVAANGLPPLIFALLYYVIGMESCLLAVLGCFAAALADTFSSEIGMLSKKEPFYILTRKPIQRGMSGGVTTLGFLGALPGAVIISVLSIPRFGIPGMTAVIAAGLIGTVTDSVLGAAFQAKYRVQGGNGMESALTERKSLDGVSLELARGIRWMNNDAVNFAGIFVCGLLLTFAAPFLIK